MDQSIWVNTMTKDKCICAYCGKVIVSMEEHYEECSGRSDN
jgi:hypothetical protein